MDEVAAWRPLIEAFLCPLMFLETCDDETVDPDIAVQQMEDIVAALDTLDRAQKMIVIHILERIASETVDARRREAILITSERLSETDQDAGPSQGNQREQENRRPSLGGGLLSNT